MFTFTNSYISSLATIGGHETKRVTCMFHDDVGRTINWKGMNGKKIIQSDGVQEVTPVSDLVWIRNLYLFRIRYKWTPFRTVFRIRSAASDPPRKIRYGDSL
ncbi:uncharacterized protein LOC120477571 [Tachysurus ichikawai]